MSKFGKFHLSMRDKVSMHGYSELDHLASQSSMEEIVKNDLELLERMYRQKRAKVQKREVPQEVVIAARQNTKPSQGNMQEPKARSMEKSNKKLQSQ